MLKSLHIKGLAVVDELHLDFSPGMTVLTGETGAGKSILLTAMGLCLGDRADSSYIRPGVDRAEVSLEFSVSDVGSASDWLQQHELDDDDLCIIRRTIHADGRSRAFINGQPMTLQRLQNLTEHLINIHGQHDHLNLLQADQQRQLLDDALPDQQLIHQCRDAYQSLQSLLREQQQLTGESGDHTQQKELLRYRIEELETARVAELDYQALLAEHAQLANMEQILAIGQSQLDRLIENDEQSLHGLLSDSQQQLQQLASLSVDFEPVAQQIQEMLIQLQETCRDLRHSLDGKELDPAQLAELDERLSHIHRLARKLQVSPEELADTLTSLQAQLAALERQDQRVNQLQSEIEQAQATYQQCASLLSTARCDAATSLSQQISSTLSTLGMPDGKFLIQVDHDPDAPPSRHGQDHIRFCVTTNPGLPIKPMAKVASGGELSRICLAIQVIVTEQTSAPTLIFDEVDSGIGGGVAETVGSRLRQIGQTQQVFCVTHLPQVAAQGHQHLFVSKVRSEDSTSSRVNALNGKQRTQEIARMLGGLDISQKTLAHAEEMLQLASSA